MGFGCRYRSLRCLFGKMLSSDPPSSEKCSCTNPAVDSTGVHKRPLNTQLGGEEAVCLNPMIAVDQFKNMIEFQPNAELYRLHTSIGKGCHDAAAITVAEHLPSGSTVAIKRISIEDCEIDYTQLQHEIMMHTTLHHPNILPSFCTFVNKQEIWCVMPLMGFGSCRDLLHAHFTDGLPELAISHILRDVLEALNYIHSLGIIHRCLRTSHILVSGNGHVCLSGLRYSYNMLNKGRRDKTVHDFPEHYIRSLLWASPELLEQNMAGYNTKSDIYSLGITACELANGVVPFEDMPRTQMLLEKLEGTVPRLLDSHTIPELRMDDGANLVGTTVDGSTENGGPTSITKSIMPYDRTFSQHFHHFVELCLQTDPKLRPTAATLLQHSFFKQLKRKSGIVSLPELLQPVAPLSDIANLPEDDLGVDDVAHKLGDIELEEVTWSF